MPRLVLHVGAMKSGTTYLQSRLFANRDELARRGVLLPGPEWRHQVYAAQQALRGGGRRWTEHAAAIAGHPGTSVFTMEFLGTAREEDARRIRADLAVDDVEVVLTVRDLNRGIAAMWQETVQNGHTWTWPAFLDGVERDRPWHRGPRPPATGPGRHFWLQQNLVRIARVWGSVVGPDRVTVVTVPRPGAARDVLWTRFADVLGVDPDGLVEGGWANESLGAASALAMRRVNELLVEQGLPFPTGMAQRKGVLCRAVLGGHRGAEPSLGLPVADWVREHSDAATRRLQDLGVRLVGEWSDLDPVAVPGVGIEEVSQADVAEAAAVGLAGVLGTWIRAQDERAATGSDTETGAEPAGTTRAREDEGP